MNVHASVSWSPISVRRNSTTARWSSSAEPADEPQHQVGVGAEPHGRIRAADADVVPQRLKSSSISRHRAGPVLLVGEPIPQLRVAAKTG